MYELKAKIKDEAIVWDDNQKKEFYKCLAKYEGKEISIDIKPYKNARTTKQNKALHLWFTQLAEALNESGFDMKSVIREVDIPWSAYTIKEHLFRPTMKQVFGYKSTRNLKTGDIDKIFDIINKAIGERTGVHIPFPCIEELMQQDLNN